MFRATFIDPVQGRAMARFANRTLKARTAAVVYDPSSVYSSGLATFFREAFGTENGNVTAYIAYNSSLDLETVLQTLQKSQADVIYLPMYHWQALPLVRQMRAETIAVPILGCDGWDNGQFAQLAEAEKLMPLYFTNHYSMGRRIVNRVMPKFGKSESGTGCSFSCSAGSVDFIPFFAKRVHMGPPAAAATVQTNRPSRMTLPISA